MIPIFIQEGLLHTEKDCSEYLANLNCPILTEDERRACKGMLSQGEIYNSFKDLPANKTPGNDGLSKEFYSAFYDLLGKDLQECYKHSFEKGKLAPSQYQAVIVLIEKRGKDKRYIRNCRPISLLNVDTKILSKALASRLKKVIAQLISHDQTAYVPKRNICEAIRLTNDLFEYADSHPISAYMVTADIEKAFDSVDHNFLFATLKKFGLGPEFISWVTVLIKNQESCIMNNGKTTKYFLCLDEQDKEILCQLFLFILTLEVLFILVRSDSQIEGMMVSGKEVKLTSFADDATYFLLNIASVYQLFRDFDEFQAYSSLKVNREKSEISGLGLAKGELGALCGCKTVNLLTDSIYILGIHHSYNQKLAENRNLLSLIGGLQNVISLWKSRGLTLAGKIQIFKTFGISKFLYLSTMTNIPKSIIEEVHKIQENFLWNEKNSKIKHSTLIGEYEWGGLKKLTLRQN